jgi:rfaE bifunctional protein kinase chain/domain
MRTYRDLVTDFSSLHVMVIGDVMIDSYCWGKVERISPEAPVPVVSVQNWNHRLGGAANVALNVKALGGTVSICSVIGQDDSGSRMMELLGDSDVYSKAIVHSAARPTTVKTRVIAAGHHIVRIDEEVTSPLSNHEEELLLQAVIQEIERKRPDVIILEDYNKGVLTPRVIHQVIQWANEHAIPTTVDPKKDHFFEYKGCTLFKPNLKEMREGLKREINPKSKDELESAILLLEQNMENECTLLTLSEHGVVMHGQQGFHFENAHPREVVDVSGAGDSVISVASMALALQATVEQIAFLSNLAGGLVCEKVGVVPIESKCLLDELNKHF